MLILAHKYFEESPDQLFEKYSNLFRTRDLARYECTDHQTISDLHMCRDGLLKLVSDVCVIISLGANKNDYSFEKAILAKERCQIDTFDPFNEPEVVKKQRIRNLQESSYTVEMTENWRFHRIGILDHGTKAVKAHSIGWLDSFPHIIDHIGMGNKTIDLLKLDIAGAEWEFMRVFDVEDACVNIKQLVIDTHPLAKGKHISTYMSLMKRLEKCFLLFHRTSRLFQTNADDERVIDKKLLLKKPAEKMGTKPMSSKNYKLQELFLYHNEIDMVEHLFLYGRLSFVNKNFL